MRSKATVLHSRFLVHPMSWYFSQHSVGQQRLRGHLSSLDIDLARYVNIHQIETADAATRLDIFKGGGS